MLKKTLFAGAIVASLGFSAAASADSLNIGNTPLGSDTFTATSISFVNPGSVGPVSGIFGSLACASCLQMTNFNSGSTNFTVFTVNTGTHTDTTTLTSVTFTGTADALTIRGTGTTVIDGGAATPIAFILTTQVAPGQEGTATSYSGSITTVPLPGTWSMLLGSLLGLGLFAYYGSKKQARSVSMLA